MVSSTVPSTTQQPAPETHVPVVDHALKARAIQNDRAMRAAGNAKATAQLLLSGLDTAAMQDLLDLQLATWQRLTALQQGWVSDWVGWFNYADKIKGANTMSKLIEMESNIAAQAAQLMGSQITSLVALQENVEVDYAYLIKQILAARAKPA